MSRVGLGGAMLSVVIACIACERPRGTPKAAWDAGTLNSPHEAGTEADIGLVSADAPLGDASEIDLPAADAGIAEAAVPNAVDGPTDAPAADLAPSGRANGSPCNADSECDSKSCVDRICCDSKCGDICRSCRLGGNAGQCLPIPDGESPRGDCRPDPANPCMHDGKCDGKGTCRLAREGAACGMASCSGSTFKPSPTCSGSGTCRPSAAQECQPGEACSKALGCQYSYPTCATVSTCLKPICSQAEADMRFAADAYFVVDRQNGNRLWQRTFGAKKTYAEAESFCSSLSLSGITGWRVPSSSEIGSLIFKPGGIGGCRDDKCCPAIDQAAFPGLPEYADFWSSSLDTTGNYRTYIDFYDGRGKKTGEQTLMFVRCVHDPL